jgi:hypothetical protein
MPETPDRDARSQARWHIVQAANRHKLRVRRQPRLFGMRQLQQAVFVARQHQLVSPHTLDLAGFRPVRGR